MDDGFFDDDEAFADLGDDAFGDRLDDDVNERHMIDLMPAVSSPSPATASTEDRKRQREEGGDDDDGDAATTLTSTSWHAHPHLHLLGAPPPITADWISIFAPAVPPHSRPVVINTIAQARLNVGVDLRALSAAVRTVEFLPQHRIPIAILRLRVPTAVLVVRTSGTFTIIGAKSLSESRQAAELGARIIRKAVDLPFTTFQFRLRSLTARFNLCSPVRLDLLAQHVFTKECSAGGVSALTVSYEPERFNGCTIRMTGTLRRRLRNGRAQQQQQQQQQRVTEPFLPSSPSDTKGTNDRDDRAGDDAHSGSQNRWSVACVVFVTGKLTFLGARSAEELDFGFHAVLPVLALYIQPQDNSSPSAHTETIKAAIQELKAKWRRQRALEEGLDENDDDDDDDGGSDYFEAPGGRMLGMMNDDHQREQGGLEGASGEDEDDDEYLDTFQDDM